MTAVTWTSTSRSTNALRYALYEERLISSLAEELKLVTQCLPIIDTFDRLIVERVSIVLLYQVSMLLAVMVSQLNGRT